MPGKGRETGQKTILITGATDGIGLETARMLAALGHHVLVHGRSPGKVAKVESALRELPGEGRVEGYVADLARMAEVEALATAVAERHSQLDVLINNAGVFRAADPVTPDGLDVRFAVNTLAPCLLTMRLLLLIPPSGRVVNVASAAQAPVDLEALAGGVKLPDMTAYAQSKLALITWSRTLGLARKKEGPTIVAVNPGSMLGSKMVRDAFGAEGRDLRIGAEILCRAALADEFSAAAGEYFDNDSGKFRPPHAAALDPGKSKEVVDAIRALLTEIAGPDKNGGLQQQ